MSVRRLEAHMSPVDHIAAARGGAAPDALSARASRRPRSRGQPTGELRGDEVILGGTMAGAATRRRRAKGAARPLAALRATVAVTLALWATGAAAQGAARCRFTQAPPTLAFTAAAPYTGLAAITLTATLRYRCPGWVGSAWIGISPARSMTGPGTLQFELYQLSGSVWPAAPVPVDPDATVVTFQAVLPAQNAIAGLHATPPPGLEVRIYTSVFTIETDLAYMPATATVTKACTIQPATLAFGSYDPLGANATTPRDAQGTIQIACTGTTAYAVGLGLGSNAAGAVRQMASGASRLAYELYSDAARTTVWSPTAVVGGTAPSTAPIPLPVYGRILPGQMVPAGAYQDVVVSTINF
jgi:spore coat protein U-like protein